MLGYEGQKYLLSHSLPQQPLLDQPQLGILTIERTESEKIFLPQKFLTIFFEMLLRLFERDVVICQCPNVRVVPIESLHFLQVVEKQRLFCLFVPCLDHLDDLIVSEARPANFGVVAHEVVGPHLVAAEENDAVDVVAALDELVALVGEVSRADDPQPLVPFLPVLHPRPQRFQRIVRLYCELVSKLAQVYLVLLAVDPEVHPQVTHWQGVTANQSLKLVHLVQICHVLSHSQSSISIKSMLSIKL